MVMKREVVGYTTMSEHLIDTQLTLSPFSLPQQTSQCSVVGSLMLFSNLFLLLNWLTKPNSFGSRPYVMSATIHYRLS